MLKAIFILVVIACLTSIISAEKSCLSQCGKGCYADFTNKKCLYCPAGCSDCKDANTCLTCLPGFFLNDEKNCVKCNVTGCATCTQDGGCTACQEGFYLVNRSSCVSCGTYCKTCASATTCKTCRDDIVLVLERLKVKLPVSFYRDVKTGECDLCSIKCSSCNSLEVCTACFPGFVLNDFQCVKCSDPDCMTCDETQENCLKCFPGYYLLNNHCVECSAGCLECNDESECQKCNTGFHLNARKGCTRCISNCKTCEDSITCSECADGYEYDETKKECTTCKFDCP